jgi:gamma-polyglutamate biosynthesis protein CapC
MSVVLSLGVGLTCSLALAETLSIAPGGYIVPGYIAFNLGSPARVAATIGVAIATLLLMKLISQFAILYGMRRFVLFLIAGFALGTAYAALIAQGPREPTEAIGFVVPGLIALWMEKQGALITLGSMLTVAVVARFAILLFARV